MKEVRVVFRERCKIMEHALPPNVRVPQRYFDHGDTAVLDSYSASWLKKIGVADVVGGKAAKTRAKKKDESAEANATGDAVGDGGEG